MYRRSIPLSFRLEASTPAHHSPKPARNARANEHVDAEKRAKDQFPAISTIPCGAHLKKKDLEREEGLTVGSMDESHVNSSYPRNIIVFRHTC